MSSKRQRQAAIKFRVTPGEEACIHAAARGAGLPLARFAREATLSASKAGPLVNGTKLATSRALRDITVEINRMAVAARKRTISPADADRIEFELRRLQRLLFHFHYKNTVL